MDFALEREMYYSEADFILKTRGAFGGSLPVPFSAFSDPHGYAGAVPSAKYLATMFFREHWNTARTSTDTCSLAPAKF